MRLCWFISVRSVCVDVNTVQCTAPFQCSVPFAACHSGAVQSIVVTEACRVDLELATVVCTRTTAECMHFTLFAEQILKFLDRSRFVWRPGFG